MFERFLTSFQKVEKAKTQKEREGIYRLRYKVYIEELNKGFLPNVDHEKKFIKDPEDENPHMGLFYTGEPGNPTGTIRVDIYPPGKVPDDVAKRFSLNLFPWLSTEPIAEICRLVINPEHRGGFILLALGRKVFEFCVLDTDTVHGFLYCAPGLVKAYAKLGFRPYAGDLIFNSDGVRVPMILIASDDKFMKQARSPLAPLVKKHFGPGLKLPVNLELYKNLLGDDAAPYQLDFESIYHKMEEEFLQGQATDTFMIKGLTPQIIKDLSRRGFIIEVSPNQVLVRKGLHEKEMFLIIEGVYEVFNGDKTIAILNPGDIFGELAFFLDSGKRTASIRSLSSGRVLVLRRHFLKEMIKKDPRLAAHLLMNISTVVARRLANMLD